MLLLPVLTLFGIHSSALAFSPNSWFHKAQRRKQSHRNPRNVATLRSSNGNYFDPDFAPRVADKVHPSVALVLPVGVRNSTSQGSGFVVDFPDTRNKNDKKSLHLLTAAHVAAPGLRLLVSFPQDHEQSDNSPRPATCIGRDVSLDLALIRIDPQDGDDSPLPQVEPLPMSCLEENQVGTLVFANGYPGGISNKQPAMTMGIVCGMAHGSLRETAWFAPSASENENKTSTADSTSDSSTSSFAQNNSISFVVTDAAMAGGMSGGPLVNLDGQVVGVNALVRMDMRALGNYAVSASTCREFLSRLAQAQIEDTQDQEASGYRVILYNDRMNKRARVSQILQEVASLNKLDADKVMMSAHTTGRGVVREFARGDRDEADVFCEALRKEDILVEVEQLS